MVLQISSNLKLLNLDFSFKAAFASGKIIHLMDAICKEASWLYMSCFLFLVTKILSFTKFYSGSELFCNKVSNSGLLYFPLYCPISARILLNQFSQNSSLWITDHPWYLIGFLIFHHPPHAIWSFWPAFSENPTGSV